MNQKWAREPDLPGTLSPDPVEQASLDSFPASDPPSWAPLHVGRPSTAQTPDTPGAPGAEATDSAAIKQADRGSSGA